MMVVLAACSSGGGGAAPAADENDSGGGRDIIRFAFAPDPVWDYMRDTGVLAEWEAQYNLRIVTSESWSEFDYFAQGHGDIVSMATHELPLLEQETNTKVVAFGKYNYDRIALMRRAGDNWDTIADLAELENPKTCVGSAVSTTILWSVIADQLHNLDYRVGSDQFEVEVADYFDLPQMLLDEDCHAVATLPEAAVEPLRTGEMEIMYGSRPPWRVYMEDVCQCDHKGMMSNLFVATEEWYDAHPDQAAAFLDLWERGIQLWQQNKEEIVKLYPQHFAVETEDDTEWIVEYMEGPDDWFVDTVYLDEEWIEGETQLYDDMREAGWMTPGTEVPRYEALAPPS